MHRRLFPQNNGQLVEWHRRLEFPGAHGDALLFARIERILSERHGRVTNRELSELLSYNGSYLGRIVKKHTGRSLFDYSMTFAMAYAARELAATGKTVGEIASELQFTNLSHFYRLFHARFGLTPNEYRIAHRRDN